MTRLANKFALVTGGTSGIGLATARRFLEEGAAVAITGTSAEKLAAAKAELGEVLTIHADAGDVAGQAAVVEAIRAAFGRLDVLFVNAGVADFRPLEAWDEAGFDRSFAVNVKGPLFLVQALLPVLGKTASIVLNGSINARLGKPNSIVYAATKAALISMARTLSGELVGRGVRVNVVSPGPVTTPIYGKLGLSDGDLSGMKDYLIGAIPIGRFGDPLEIADAVVHLASDESRYTVGSELIIDGGMSNL
ncbi:SDR family oxidoreductase (plasmid) [Novosphingobium resinovorum]|uniref:Short-chain dehydrogenase n=1 Tax=Novosphingobium resinovorum TaxID=158500 RepID=A0A1D8AF86_9SPHN|nr:MULTISPECIES: SDR family oxidoreductase [Novosphingobium]AOR80788.1 short-chain dehydrogenase [Novosphingobium resinovorum]MBF7015644.1 SDR family oxidoreductase [Novosphingobium sp. HR1a]WJM30319.1 SDR family oxidoreductase [Novosphingobium resinovorum]